MEDWRTWELEELFDDDAAHWQAMHDALIGERQVGGSHYQKAIEPWAAMEAWLSPDEFTGYLRGNVIKYMARYKDKNGVEDLLKAHHYLEKLIEIEEGL